MDMQYVFKAQAKDITKIKSSIEQQLSKTDQVVASQAAVGEVFRDVTCRLGEDISGGFSAMSNVLQELCYINESGFREISDRLDLQNEKLAEIREILKKPLDTLARELRTRAENAYLNNWIDEAESDLLEAEKKNYQDFFIHSILGNIYFFYRKDYPSALNYFGKAAKYALPVSKEFASKAYLSLGMTFFEINAIQDAYHSSQSAFNINPENEDVLYTHAVFSANAGQMSVFIECLKKSICIDPRYLILADTDCRLVFCRNHIHELARTLRDEEKTQIHDLKTKLEEIRKKLLVIGIEDLQQDIQMCTIEVDRLTFADNYLDCRTARILAADTLTSISDKTEKLKEALAIIDKAKDIHSFLSQKGFVNANKFGLNPSDIAPLSEEIRKADTLVTQKAYLSVTEAANIVSVAMRRFYYQHNQKLRSGIESLQSEVSRAGSKEYGCLTWIVAIGIFMGGGMFIAYPADSSGLLFTFLVLGIISLFTFPKIMRSTTKANLEHAIATERQRTTELSDFFKQFQ